MRGRILNRSFVVIDEAQNCTCSQIKMLLTRLGWNSTMVVTGDPDQSNLLPGMSGLQDIATRLDTLEDVAVIRFTNEDVVWHPLVSIFSKLYRRNIGYPPHPHEGKGRFFRTGGVCRNEGNPECFDPRFRDRILQADSTPY